MEAPTFTGDLRPPSPFWAVFDRALAHGLEEGWTPLHAEEYALAQAEAKHPGGRRVGGRRV